MDPRPESSPRRNSLHLLIEAMLCAFVVLMPLTSVIPLSRPLVSDVLWLYVTPGLEAADLPALALVVLVGIDSWQRYRRGEARPRRSWPFATLVLLLALLAFASAGPQSIAALVLYTALRWLLAAALVWAVASSGVAPQRVALILAYGLCGHAIVALLQVMIQNPLGLPAELALPPDAPGANTVTLGNRLWLRGYGLTFHPNVLGGYLAVGLLVLLPLLARPAVRAMWLLLALALAVTLSRSAALALLVVLPPTAWWLARRDAAVRRALVQIGLVIATATLLSAPWWWKPVVTRLDPVLNQLGVRGVVSERAVRAEAGSLWARRLMNRIALEQIEAHPTLGIGAGNFPVVMVGATEDLAPQPAHNVALLLGAEVGIVGLLVWCALPCWATLLFLRGRRSVWFAVGTAACWALFIISMFDCYPWSLNAGRLLTVTVLALLEMSALSSTIDHVENVA